MLLIVIKILKIKKYLNNFYFFYLMFKFLNIIIKFLIDFLKIKNNYFFDI